MCATFHPGHGGVMATTITSFLPVGRWNKSWRSAPPPRSKLPLSAEPPPQSFEGLLKLSRPMEERFVRSTLRQTKRVERFKSSRDLLVKRGNRLLKLLLDRLHQFRASCFHLFFVGAQDFPPLPQREERAQCRR